jgi:hypothetical protein
MLTFIVVVLFDSILLPETFHERAAANSLSIDLALAFAGGGYFDYMGKTARVFNRDVESPAVSTIHSIRWQQC